MRKDAEQIVSYTNLGRIGTVLFRELIIFQVLVEIGTLSLDIFEQFSFEVVNFKSGLITSMLLFNKVVQHEFVPCMRGHWGLVL